MTLKLIFDVRFDPINIFQQSRRHARVTAIFGYLDGPCFNHHNRKFPKNVPQIAFKPDYASSALYAIWYSSRVYARPKPIALLYRVQLVYAKNNKGVMAKGVFRYGQNPSSPPSPPPLSAQHTHTHNTCEPSFIGPFQLAYM